MESPLHWLNAHLLSCPTKAWLGVDCPGCGFQRSLLALLQGDLRESWAHYPPLIPFLVMVLLLVLAFKSQMRYRMQALSVSVAITCLFIAVNFALKFI